MLIQSSNCIRVPTVKVRFQNPAVVRKYHSTIHAITTIIREERFVGLYKGIISPLVNDLVFLYFPSGIDSKFLQTTIALMNGLVFASYKFFMKVQLDNPTSIPTITQIALAGAGSGIVSSYVPVSVNISKRIQLKILTS